MGYDIYHVKIDTNLGTEEYEVAAMQPVEAKTKALKHFAEHNPDSYAMKVSAEYLREYDSPNPDAA